jgi:hypothetical protein
MEDNRLVLNMKHPMGTPAFPTAAMVAMKIQRIMDGGVTGNPWFCMR